MDERMEESGLEGLENTKYKAPGRPDKLVRSHSSDHVCTPHGDTLSDVNAWGEGRKNIPSGTRGRKDAGTNAAFPRGLYPVSFRRMFVDPPPLGFAGPTSGALPQSYRSRCA